MQQPQTELYAALPERFIADWDSTVNTRYGHQEDAALGYNPHKSERAAAAAEKQRADEQAAIAKAVNEFIRSDLLRQADSRTQAGREPGLTVKEALRRAAAGVGSRFANQPLVEVEIRTTIGGAFLGLGEALQAIPHLEQAVVSRKRLLGPEHPDTLTRMATRPRHLQILKPHKHNHGGVVTSSCCCVGCVQTVTGVR